MFAWCNHTWPFVGEKIIVKIRKQKPNLNVCQVVSVPAATYQCYSKVLCTMSLSHFQPANTCSTVNTVWSRGTYRIWHKALFCEQSARCCVVDKKCKVKFRAGWKPHSAATFQVFALIFILSSSAESFPQIPQSRQRVGNMPGGNCWCPGLGLICDHHVLLRCSGSFPFFQNMWTRDKVNKRLQTDLRCECGHLKKKKTNLHFLYNTELMDFSDCVWSQQVPVQCIQSKCKACSEKTKVFTQGQRSDDWILFFFFLSIHIQCEHTLKSLGILVQITE